MIMPELASRRPATDPGQHDGRQPVAPSAIQSKVGGDMPREMTEEDIADAINISHRVPDEPRWLDLTVLNCTVPTVT
jgi:hypothetical protein